MLICMHYTSIIPCPEFAIEPTCAEQWVRTGGGNFAKNCMGVSADRRLYLQCKHTKKLAQNKSYQLKKKPLIFYRQCSAKKSPQMLRTRRKLGVAELSVLNDSIAYSVLRRKISGLSPKQCLAVKTCFEGARRKSRCGMQYYKLWILECILKRM